MTTAKQIAAALVGASIIAFISSVFHIKGSVADLASTGSAMYLVLLAIAIALIGG